MRSIAITIFLLALGCSSASPVSPPDGAGEQGGTAGGISSGGGAPGTGGTGTGGTGTGGAGVGGASGANAGGAAGASAAGGSGTNGGGGAAGVVGTAGAAGSAAGGAGMVGAAGNGGSAPCDFSDPPANLAAWINESWAGQLGNNVKTRKAWNLDNVMLNKGRMNLCVRWGATTAVPATVVNTLESTIARWFNDWFKSLGSYGCFPYGNGITVKVTGWAVKPGQQGLLAGVDPNIPVYTGTDGDGEPKCPDACSSFIHWDHNFSGCAGGDAAHHDYWLWFDDQLPGAGNAAAVGGDWGLRMPVSTFVTNFSAKSFLIVEHEMGHGFGFQDYYTWNGSTPAGGSLMIVGSTVSSQQSPTAGDQWLLRRTWKEMKVLRGW